MLNPLDLRLDGGFFLRYALLDLQATILTGQLQPLFLVTDAAFEIRPSPDQARAKFDQRITRHFDRLRIRRRSVVVLLENLEGGHGGHRIRGLLHLGQLHPTAEFGPFGRRGIRSDPDAAELDLTGDQARTIGLEGRSQLARFRHVFAVSVIFHERAHPFQRRVVDRWVVGRGWDRESRHLGISDIVLTGALDLGHIRSWIGHLLADCRTGLDLNEHRLRVDGKNFSLDFLSVAQLDRFAPQEGHRESQKAQKQQIFHCVNVAVGKHFVTPQCVPSARGRWQGWPWRPG